MTTEQKPLRARPRRSYQERARDVKDSRSPGFAAWRASAGARGSREGVARCRPSVILMDLSLFPPDGSGSTATRSSRRRASQGGILSVALTGHALAGASEGARPGGLDAFVTKPCLPDELVLEVRRMLGHRDGAPAGLTDRLDSGPSGLLSLHSGRGHAPVAPSRAIHSCGLARAALPCRRTRRRADLRWRRRPSRAFPLEVRPPAAGRCSAGRGVSRCWCVQVLLDQCGFSSGRDRPSSGR